MPDLEQMRESFLDALFSVNEMDSPTWITPLLCLFEGRHESVDAMFSGLVGEVAPLARSKLHQSKLCIDQMILRQSVPITDDELSALYSQLLSADAYLRCRSLDALLAWAVNHGSTLSKHDDLMLIIWLLTHDDGESEEQEEEFSALADKNVPMEKAAELWILLNGDIKCLPRQPTANLLPFLNSHGHLRSAIVDALLAQPPTADQIESEYRRLLKERAPAQPSARLKINDVTWEARLALAEITVNPIMLFFCCREAFWDPHAQVNEAFLQAALGLLKSVEDPEAIRSLLEQCLANPLKNADAESSDRVRVFLIILLGSIAPRLSIERQSSVIRLLVDTLATPSDAVQSAVADALVPILKEQSQGLDDLITGWRQQLMHPTSMALRRGAAYGLAATVAARGLILMSRLSLPEILSGDRIVKQGALQTCELLARRLGRAFEPYTVAWLPLVLQILGQEGGSKPEVRQACLDAMEAMMATASASAIQRLLPRLVKTVEQDSENWRARAAAVEWLGSLTMAAPSTLRAHLGSVLPPLVAALGDSHGNVQQAARQALSRYGRVLRSPELVALLPVLLDALADPPTHATRALDRLLTTRFAHLVDGASLALLEPLLRRALMDRSAGSADNKRRAAQILANLATSLVDPIELTGCLPSLLPALRDCLSDPVPLVRSTAARVLGMLVRRVAIEDGRPCPPIDCLLPNLLTELRASEAKSLSPLNPNASTSLSKVDREGCAQALSETLAAYGPEKIKSILAGEIPIGLKGSSREGWLSLLAYLPVTLTADNTSDGDLIAQAGLGQWLPAVLQLQADPQESVREQASKTAKGLVEQMAAIDRHSTLAAIVTALSDVSWRVRLGAVTLLQDLFLRIAGHQPEEEDESGVLPSVDDLLRMDIAVEQIRQLQSRLLLSRFDPASGVLRSTALTLWKALAVHPVRTVTDILPLLLVDAASMLEQEASEDEEEEDGSAVMALRAWEDLFGRMGERIAGPFLQQVSAQPKLNRGLMRLLLLFAQQIGRVELVPLPQLIDSLSPFVLASLADPDLRPLGAQLFSRLIQGIGRLDPANEDGLVDQMLRKCDQDSLSLLIKVRPAIMDRVMRQLAGQWEPRLRALEGADAIERARWILPLMREATETEGKSDLLIVLVMNRLACLLDDDENSSELAGWLEELWGGGEMDRAMRIFTSYAQHAPLFDHLRFTANWIRRLVSFNPNQQACEALLNRVSESEVALEEAVEGLYTAPKLASGGLDLNGLTKQVIVPALIQPQASPSCRHQAHLVGRKLLAQPGWTAGSLAPLCGALIRVSTNRGDARVDGLEGLVELLEKHCLLAKPFWPQIQRLLNQGILEHAPRLGSIREEESVIRTLSFKGMVKLLPLLTRPDSLLLEWCAGLSGEPAEEEEEEAKPFAAPVALAVLPLIKLIPIAKLEEHQQPLMAALRVRLVDADAEVRREALSLRDVLSSAIPALSQLTVI